MRALSRPDTLSSSSAQSLGVDEFAALAEAFAPFPDRYRFAVAVSGGSDSMALAFCAQRWANAHGFSAGALIVDHALRPESSAEAEATRQRLVARGLEAEILRWEHDDVVTRLHATARKARYRLLTEACRRHGIHDLWLAHQMEDQAETILMRLAKGSGIDGLAGMRGINTLDGVRLLRPLLGVAKARLAATCVEAKLAFVDDASNRSEKFARGRIRRVLPLLAEEGLTLERLIELGARATEAKDALDHYTHELLHRAATRDEAGVIRIALDPLRDAPREIAGRALTLALQHIHAEDYAPEYASLMDLLDALRAEADMPARTLHGCLISRTPVQATIMREISNITDAPIIRRGESVLWDKRWNVTLEQYNPSPLAGEDRWGGVTQSSRLDLQNEHHASLTPPPLTPPARGGEFFVIRPLGSPPHEVIDALAPKLRKLVPQGRARASLPALWQGDKLTLIPAIVGEGVAQARLAAAWPPR